MRVLVDWTQAGLLKHLTPTTVRCTPVTTIISDSDVGEVLTLVCLLMKGSIVIMDTLPQSNEVSQESLDPFKNVIKAFSLTALDLTDHLEHFFDECLLFLQFFKNLFKVSLTLISPDHLEQFIQESSLKMFLLCSGSDRFAQVVLELQFLLLCLLEQVVQLLHLSLIRFTLLHELNPLIATFRFQACHLYFQVLDKLLFSCKVRQLFITLLLQRRCLVSR